MRLATTFHLQTGQWFAEIDAEQLAATWSSTTCSVGKDAIWCASLRPHRSRAAVAHKPPGRAADSGGPATRCSGIPALGRLGARVFANPATRVAKTLRSGVSCAIGATPAVVPRHPPDSGRPAGRVLRGYGPSFGEYGYWTGSLRTGMARDRTTRIQLLADRRGLLLTGADRRWKSWSTWDGCRKANVYRQLRSIV